ncbi:hypothetical protein ACFQRB_18640 [Halobaculum litoreum]|uniref:DUF7998 domain-containing protein n=1 Tax=Halobaculum litoreum TaxID=3031998 RepID=A0ABD5XVJ5_9EURY
MYVRSILVPVRRRHGVEFSNRSGGRLGDRRAHGRRVRHGRADRRGPVRPPDAFVPSSLPEPGEWLGSGDASVLTGAAHVGVRAVVREAFAERGVRDATFGYVLTKLERDRAHPDAGLRYARDGRTLRVEFVPTTEFCPQGDRSRWRCSVRSTPSASATGSRRSASASPRTTTPQSR